MKRNYFLLVVAIIITLIAFAIAIPSFSFNFNGDNVEITGLNPKTFGLSFLNPDFAFQPSIDLQGGNYITMNIDLSSTDASKRKDELDLIRSTIFFRLWNAKIDGFQINTLNTSDSAKYVLTVTAPQSVDQSIMDFVLMPGNLSIWVANTDNTTSPYQSMFGNRVPLNIANEDIVNSQMVSDSRCYFQSSTTPRNFCVLLTLNSRAQSELATALQANPYSQTPVVAALDYYPVGVQAVGQTYNPGAIGSSLLIYPIIIPDESLPTSEMATIMGSPPLSSDITIQQIQTVDPILGKGVVDEMKISLFLGFVSANALIIYYFKRRGILFTLTSAMFLIWGIALMKVISITLSLPLLMGAVTGTALFISILISGEYKIRTAFKGNLTAEELREIYNAISAKVRNITLAMIVISFIIGFYATTSMTNFTTGLGIMLISSLLVTIIGFKALLPFLLLKKKHE